MEPCLTEKYSNLVENIFKRRYTARQNTVQKQDKKK